MKKKLLFIPTILVAMCHTAQAAPTLSLGSLSSAPGDPVSIELSISNATEAYGGINARLIVPPCVTVTGISEGAVLAGNDFSLAYWAFADETEQGLSVIAYSATGTFNSDGVLMSLDLQVGADCDAQTFQLGFADTNIDPLVRNNHAVSNADGSVSLSHLVTNGSITVGESFEDTDRDGMNDDWERHYFVDLSHDGTGHSDGDGLTDLEEFLGSTNPTETDSDGDGMPDDWELRYGLNPNVNDADKDADDDGNSNIEEYLSGTPPVTLGDVNRDKVANLEDLVMVIQVMAGMDTAVVPYGDVNGDEKIGVAEAVYLLRTVSGL